MIFKISGKQDKIPFMFRHCPDKLHVSVKSTSTL